MTAQPISTTHGDKCLRQRLCGKHVTDQQAQNVRPSCQTRSRSKWNRKRWFWLAVNIGAALPLLWLGWDAWQGNLSVNPIDDFTDRTGSAAIIMLMLSLACTPIVSILGIRIVATARKSLGLWAFVYATLHMLVFIGLDYGFNVQFILEDGLFQKRYIFVGLISLLIMLPLALTSTKVVDAAAGTQVEDAASLGLCGRRAGRPALCLAGQGRAGRALHLRGRAHAAPGCAHPGGA